MIESSELREVAKALGLDPEGIAPQDIAHAFNALPCGSGSHRGEVMLTAMKNLGGAVQGTGEIRIEVVRNVYRALKDIGANV
jgi:hypothetical protein